MFDYDKLYCLDVVNGQQCWHWTVMQTKLTCHRHAVRVMSGDSVQQSSMCRLLERAAFSLVMLVKCPIATEVTLQELYRMSGKEQLNRWASRRLPENSGTVQTWRCVVARSRQGEQQRPEKLGRRQSIAVYDGRSVMMTTLNEGDVEVRRPEELVVGEMQWRCPM